MSRPARIRECLICGRDAVFDKYCLDCWDDIPRKRQVRDWPRKIKVIGKGMACRAIVTYTGGYMAEVKRNKGLDLGAKVVMTEQALRTRIRVLRDHGCKYGKEQKALREMQRNWMR